MSKKNPKADIVIYGLASATIFPNSYKGKKTKPSWEVVEEKNVSICGYEGKISWIGPSEKVFKEVNITPDARFFNAHGLVAIPGFVDSHTHLVYAGDRSKEFEMRVQGASYLDILEAGGGILNTTQAVRKASEDELVHSALQRIEKMISMGVTTVEIKTGYGLDLKTEMKMLRVIDKIKKTVPINVVATFMGAHAIPTEFKDSPDTFVDLICESWIPEVASSGLADFNDVFTEKKAFNLQQSRKILEAGLRYGLPAKIHADEITELGGVDLAVELGAVSADHLLVTKEAGIQKLRKSGVIPTLLPGTSTFLMESRHANARAMIDAGLPVAIASDHNPGSCQFMSPFIIQTLAMLNLKMTAAEALIAGTLHAAYALNLGQKTGSLEVGKDFDLVLINAPSFHHIAYQAGNNLVYEVFSKGHPLLTEG